MFKLVKMDQTFTIITTAIKGKLCSGFFNKNNVLLTGKKISVESSPFLEKNTIIYQIDKIILTFSEFSATSTSLLRQN